MAGRPKLGSKAEIANKLSKSKKAPALQSEQAQASVLTYNLNIWNYDDDFTVHNLDVFFTVSWRNLLLNKILNRSICRIRVTATPSSAAAERADTAEPAQIIQRVVQNSTPAVLSSISADPVMDSRLTLLSTQQLIDVNFALKKVKECNGNWPFATSWFYPTTIWAQVEQSQLETHLLTKRRIMEQMDRTSKMSNEKGDFNV